MDKKRQQKQQQQSAAPAVDAAMKARYDAWIVRVRQLAVNIHDASIEYVRAIMAEESSGIHWAGGWGSFEICVERDFGIDAKRWIHLRTALTRFGEDFIRQYGFQVAITCLRAPAGSAAESAIIAELTEWHRARGYGPSTETAATIVTRIIGARPHVAMRQPPEVERLRAELIRAEEIIRELRRQLEVEKQARTAAEAARDAAEAALAELIGSAA